MFCHDQEVVHDVDLLFGEDSENADTAFHSCNAGVSLWGRLLGGACSSPRELAVRWAAPAEIGGYPALAWVPALVLSAEWGSRLGRQEGGLGVLPCVCQMGVW